MAVLEITVNNTDTGVSAQMTVVQDDGGQRITDLRFTAKDGIGIRSSDLLLLEKLGLRLPASGSNGSLPSLAPSPVDPPGEVIPEVAPEVPAAAPKAAVKAPVKATSAKAGAKKVTGKPAQAKSAKPAKTTKPAKSAKSQAERSAEHRTPATAKAVQDSGRQYRKAPEAAELQRLMAEHGGPKGVADALGYPQHTVAGWLRRYRATGIEFPTGEAETTPAQPQDAAGEQ